MKFIAHTLLILFTAALIQSFFPWWSAVVVAFGLSIWLGNKGFSSFLVGFLAIFLLWTGYAFMIDQQTNSILTQRIAEVLTINNKYLLILVSGIIGGLPTGFGALAGSHVNSLFSKKKSEGYYS